MLSPWQLGVPLERSRYYLLAWLPSQNPAGNLPSPPIDVALIPSLLPPTLQLLTSLPTASSSPSSAPTSPPSARTIASYLLPAAPSLFLPPALIQKFHGQILDVVPGAGAGAGAGGGAADAAGASAAASNARASTFTKAYGACFSDLLFCVHNREKFS